MKRLPEIHILSAPIRTGKTTCLGGYFKENELRVSGFLTPDITGERELFSFDRKKGFQLELGDIEVSKGMEAVRVGRFVFDGAIFRQSIEDLDLSENVDWIVIDEIGKLEVNQDQGLEPFFSRFLREYRSNTNPPKLLLVIRDHLLDAAIHKYNLQGAILNDGPWLSRSPLFRGLIMAGGESHRMGSNKALKAYHGIPQYEYVANQIRAFDSSPLLSSNVLLDYEGEQLEDIFPYKGNGPISGVLTAFERYPYMGLLTVGIDYPMLSITAIQTLITTYRIRNQSVCLMNKETGFLEPLLAVYHPRDREKLVQEFSDGNYSLRSFLEEVAFAVPYHNPIELKSHDTPNDEIQFRAR